MKDTIYTEVIIKVLDACDLYYKKKISSKYLNQIIYWAEQNIVSIEEKDLRSFFTNIEGELDSVRALANGIYIDQEEEIEDRDKVLEIISKIKSTLVPQESSSQAKIFYPIHDQY